MFFESKCSGYYSSQNDTRDEDVHFSYFLFWFFSEHNCINKSFFVLYAFFFLLLLLIVDIFDMLYLHCTRINDEIGDCDDEHATLDGRADGIEGEIFWEYDRPRE